PARSSAGRSKGAGRAGMRINSKAGSRRRGAEDLQDRDEAKSCGTTAASYPRSRAARGRSTSFGARMARRAWRAASGDCPITGPLALTGSSPDVFRDGLRLTGLELETPLEGAAGDLTGEAVLSRTFRRILTDVAFDASMRWADQPPVYIR